MFLPPRPHFSARKYRSLTAAIVFATCLPSLVQAAAASHPPHEFELKADAIYNVIAFTDWPDDAFPSPEAPFVIGLLGQGPIATLLEEGIRDERWHGRRIVLKRFKSPSQLKGCHVLFLARSEHGRWPAIRSQFAQLPILTISDSDEFAREGGIVQLIIDRNKLRLCFNVKAARLAGLNISSKVLRLASIVEERAE